MRKSNWQAVEAAKVLAQAPDDATPLVIAAVKEAEPPDKLWLYYALGLSATNKALDFLESSAKTHLNSWPMRTIVYSLGIAGEPGLRRLQRLEENAEGQLPGVIRLWREGLFSRNEEPEFAPLPKKANLPLRFADTIRR